MYELDMQAACNLMKRPPTMMRKWIFPVLTTLFLTQNVFADTMATITHIHDGDTVRATDAHGQNLRIRLANIDAPELQQADGIASRNALRQSIIRQNVRLEIVDTDQYGRKVARIWLNGQDMNLQQIQQGYAWHYRNVARRQQNRSDYAQYEAAERHAQQNRLGLWHNRQAIAPWTFRHTNKP